MYSSFKKENVNVLTDEINYSAADTVSETIIQMMIQAPNLA